MAQVLVETARPVPGVAPASLRQRQVAAPRAPARKIWTAEDLLTLPDDGSRYELVRGELIVMTPAGARHGKFASRLNRALGVYVEAHNLGEVYTADTGFVLQAAPDTLRAPDVAFVRRERIPPEGEPEGFWYLAPDLVVEIISPLETAQQVHAKVADYLRAGTRLVWLIYPDTQTAVEYRSFGQMQILEGDAMLDGGEALPGFRYPLAGLWR